MDIIKSIPPRIKPNEWVAIDIELFGAEKKRLHRPTTGRFASMAICHKDAAYIVTSQEQVQAALDNLQDAVWVFHNAMFDIRHLRRWADVPPRKKLWDIMVVDRILGGGLYDDFSLADIVRRRLDIKMDKSVRDTFETATELTDEQIQYNAEDAYLTLLACEHQKQQMDRKDFRVWTEADRPALWAMLDFRGFPIDADAWMELHEKNIAQADTIKAGMDFNPASSPQVLKRLKKGGFKRLRDTQEQSVLNAIEKYPSVPAVDDALATLEYRKYAKRASTYGKNFLDKWLEDDDGVPVIFASQWVTGAETGRTSSSNPCLNNIPARETPEYRKCFIARPGNVLVVVDVGQQEPRDAAFLSEDPKLLAVFRDKSQDVYCNMAQLMYHQSIDKSHPFRKKVKNTVLGVTYGMSPQGMAMRNKMSVDEAEQAINDFFTTFSGLHQWIERQKMSKSDYVEDIIGRKIHINPHSDQAERNRINAPIQGSAASQMKIALGRIHAGWNDEFPGLPFGCLGFVYDELIFDVPEEYAQRCADYISHHIVTASEETVNHVLPFVVDVHIGKTWACKQ